MLVTVTNVSSKVCLSFPNSNLKRELDPHFIKAMIKLNLQILMLNLRDLPQAKEEQAKT